MKVEIENITFVYHSREDYEQSITDVISKISIHISYYNGYLYFSEEGVRSTELLDTTCSFSVDQDYFYSPFAMFAEFTKMNDICDEGEIRSWVPIEMCDRMSNMGFDIWNMAYKDVGLYYIYNCVCKYINENTNNILDSIEIPYLIKDLFNIVKEYSEYEVIQFSEK